VDDQKRLVPASRAMILDALREKEGMLGLQNRGKNKRKSAEGEPERLSEEPSELQ